MLNYQDRTREITSNISQIFQKIAETKPNWSYNGEIGYYNIGCISELAIIKHIINNNPTQKDFYIMDVGAGEFKFSEQLVEDLNKAVANSEIRSDLTVHILGARGERYVGKEKVEIEQGLCALSEEDIDKRIIHHYNKHLEGNPESLNKYQNYIAELNKMDQQCQPLKVIFPTENLDQYSEGICKVYNFGTFPIENFSQALAERGFAKVTFDFVISSWTMQHLVDPVGTFMQIHENLSVAEHSGYFLSTGFFLHFKGEQPSAISMDRFLSYTNEPFLLFKGISNIFDYNSFFLKKTQESLDISMEYDGCVYPCDDLEFPGCYEIYEDGNLLRNNPSIDSNIITVFKVSDYSPYNYFYNKHNITSYLGDQKLHSLLSNNDLFTRHTDVYNGGKNGVNFGIYLNEKLLPHCGNEPEYYGALLTHIDEM